VTCFAVIQIVLHNGGLGRDARTKHRKITLERFCGMTIFLKWNTVAGQLGFYSIFDRLMIRDKDFSSPLSEQQSSCQPASGGTDNNDMSVLYFYHRSFRVRSPRMPSKTAIIQKRTTILDSGHPFFSKWWWMGAIKKARFPFPYFRRVNLK